MVLAFAYRVSVDGFIPVLDHANLAFHEAGHVFFGVLGPTLGLYGGTLGQLVFPAVATATFLRKKAPLSAAFALPTVALAISAACQRRVVGVAPRRGVRSASSVSCPLSGLSPTR